jgi:potassium-transporting ATPase potassium-binding subunit
MVSSALLLITSFLIFLLVIAKFVGNYIALLIESDLPIWVLKMESGLWSCCRLRKPGGEIH